MGGKRTTKRNLFPFVYSGALCNGFRDVWCDWHAPYVCLCARGMKYEQPIFTGFWKANEHATCRSSFELFMCLHMQAVARAPIRPKGTSSILSIKFIVNWIRMCKQTTTNFIDRWWLSCHAGKRFSLTLWLKIDGTTKRGEQSHEEAVQSSHPKALCSTYWPRLGPTHTTNNEIKRAAPALCTSVLN